MLQPTKFSEAPEFLKAIGTKAGKNLAAVHVADVSRWRDGYTKAGLSASSANQSVKILRVAFNAARRQGFILTSEHRHAREVRMKLSGHKTAVHDRYTHHELETLRREMAKVPSFTDGAAPE